MGPERVVCGVRSAFGFGFYGGVGLVEMIVLTLSLSKSCSSSRDRGRVSFGVTHPSQVPCAALDLEF